MAETNQTLVADYAPYLGGKPWPQLAVTAYVESGSNIWVHPKDPRHFPTLQEIHESDSDFTTVILRLPDGTIYKTYNDFVLGPYFSAVYCGDFNNDGKPDFMAVKPESGCGLAGEFCIGVFAISGADTYNFARVHTMGLGLQDLVLDPATSKFRLIHTSFVQGGANDGQDHSFFVHRFFEWNGMSFHEDPDLPPIWIQYLIRPNHSETKLLSPELKSKIWAECLKSKGIMDW